ncbi:hypothetical protein [Candidatus Flexifilum breve]|uniref:hypothetical protein n=1 Tax=Candidatus Flexifilum breve TaxID=3140694 RepID=UPI0031CC836E
MGHTHQPIIYEQVDEQGDTERSRQVYRQRIRLNGHRQIINPGSVGQPRDAIPTPPMPFSTWKPISLSIAACPGNIKAVQKRYA